MSTKQKKVKSEVEEFDVSKYVLSAETETHIVVIPETGDEFEELSIAFNDMLDMMAQDQKKLEKIIFYALLKNKSMQDYIS